MGLALLCGVPAALADGASPAINRQYENPEFERWEATFERAGREVYDRRAAIVAATQVRPGMLVADIGAGTGLFTLLFAEAVGAGGRVVAVDISKVFVDNIVRRAREQKLSNVTGIVSTQDDPRLPAHSLDVAFVCDTYHHFEQPEKMLAAIARALKPGGTLVVIDFEREPGSSSAWVLEHVRAGKRAVIREIEAAGFTLIEDKPLLRENFFLRFAKRADAAGRP
jgi:ubiquinone/menaquinone biosynthesis C-methylase UbiE